MVVKYNIKEFLKKGDDNIKDVINKKIYEIVKYMKMKNVDNDMVNNDI